MTYQAKKTYPRAFLKVSKKMVPWLSEDVKKEEVRQVIKKLENVRIKGKKLETLYFQLTNNCNLSCKHCWTSSGGNHKPKSLSRDTVIQLITDSLELGLKRIKFTGGEPFLYKDIIELIQFCDKNDLEIYLETNATLLVESLLEKLQRFNKLTLLISLDGITEETHDEFRGGKSFKIITNNIKKLKGYRIKFNVNTTAHKKNYKSIAEIARFSIDIGAAYHRTIITFHPIGRGKEYKDNILNFDEIIELVSDLYNKDLWKKNEYGRKMFTTLPPALHPIDSIQFAPCYGGENLCGILPDGSISICGPVDDYKKLKAGSIQTDNFKEIWTKSTLFNTFRDADNRSYEGICGNCLLCSLCKGHCKYNRIDARQNLFG